MQLTARLQQRFYKWALREKAPEASPVILNQRRVYVMPTRAGLGYALSLGTMLVGAMNYSLSLGHVLTFLLGGLGVSAILNTFRNLAFLHITPGRCTPVFAGEVAHFGLVLHNARQAERPALRLRAGDKNEGELIELQLPATDRIEALLPIKTRQRGWMPLPRVMIETRYPLGLIRAWAYVQPKQFCLVYPRPALDAPPLPSGSGDQQGSVKQGRGNDDFAGLRDHQASDSPRHVAWKAVARQHNDELLTKLFSGENAQSLWLDWDLLPPGLDVETRLCIMAHWVCEASDARLTWGMHLPGETLVPNSGEPHRHACLQALALYGK